MRGPLFQYFAQGPGKCNIDVNFDEKPYDIIFCLFSTSTTPYSFAYQYNNEAQFTRGAQGHRYLIKMARFVYWNDKNE